MVILIIICSSNSNFKNSFILKLQKVKIKHNFTYTYVTYVCYVYIIYVIIINKITHINWLVLVQYTKSPLKSTQLSLIIFKLIV